MSDLNTVNVPEVGTKPIGFVLLEGGLAERTRKVLEGGNNKNLAPEYGTLDWLNSEAGEVTDETPAKQASRDSTKPSNPGPELTDPYWNPALDSSEPLDVCDTVAVRFVLQSALDFIMELKLKGTALQQARQLVKDLEELRDAISE